MTSPSQRRDWRAVSAALFATAAVAALAALPALASADNTLALSIEPAVPGKGKPFQVIAKGTSQTPDPISGVGNGLYVGFGPGSSACAPTPGLEYALVESDNANRVQLIDGSWVIDGPFDRRVTYQGGATSNSGRIYPPFALRDGLATGRYRACGYINLAHHNEDQAPVATARLEFTVGGTCNSATKKLARAQKILKRARTALRKARERFGREVTSANARRVKKARTKVKKARTKVKKAKRKLKIAKQDRRSLC